MEQCLSLPSGWGAVEGTIWNHKLYLERAGHIVDIFNTRQFHSVLRDINRGAYDFVHCHNEMFVLQCVAHLKLPFAVTSHTPVRRLPSGEYYYGGATEYLFKDTLQASANIVLSEQIRDIYLRAGYTGLLRVLRNGVECDDFTLSEHGNGRAICVGRIARRKRQAWLSEIVADRVAVDFVGPWDRTKESTFAENATAKYLGVWDRQTLYERLSDYSCLVLLSSAEGAPKVVPEAFAAGLSVVITEGAPPISQKRTSSLLSPMMRGGQRSSRGPFALLLKKMQPFAPKSAVTRWSTLTTLWCAGTIS